MKVETTRFGMVEIAETEVITFPDGLLGFSECTRFAFVSQEMEAPFYWMQSLQIPSLAFVILAPNGVLTNYNISVRKEQIRPLETQSVADITTYLIVTMSGNLADITINLQGPVLINDKKRLGQQIVINDPGLSTRHPLFADDNLKEGSTEKVVGKQNKEASLRLAIG